MMTDKVRLFYISCVVFITGAVVLMLEILGTRIVAPYFGTTIYVWSSLIGVTLLALTAGYFIGGRLADKNPAPVILCAILLASAFFVFIIPFISNPVMKFLNGAGARAGSLLTAVVLFALPLCLLGMVTPFALKLAIKDVGSAGSVSGMLYGISTIGSFAGAISAGFYLIPMLGINIIIDIMAGVLCAAALIWLAMSGKPKLPVFFLLLIAVILVLKPHEGGFLKQGGTTVIYDRQSAYARIKVVDYMRTLRALLIDGSIQTLYDKRKDEFWVSYMKMFENSLLMQGAPKTALIVGLGGGGFDIILKKKGLDVDNVEIDPVIAEIAAKYFGFSGNVIIDDGRHYIRNTKKRYDMVFVDAFSGYSIYQYILSKESIEEIKTVLNPGGMLVINLIGTTTGDTKKAELSDGLTAAVYATAATAFKNVKLKCDDIGLANVVVYASEKDFKTSPLYIDAYSNKQGTVLTDNYNPAESLMLGTSEKWRNEYDERAGKIIPM